MRTRLFSAHAAFITTAALALGLVQSRAYAIEVPLGDDTLALDVNNTTELGYHFNNRNDTAVDPNNPTLAPAQHVDDDYAEWFDRLYLRAHYRKLSLGLRLDSAVFIDTPTRADVQTLVRDKLGRDDLALENRFNEELHSRYGAALPGGARGVIYPAKLWVGFKHKSFEATAGDFYEQLGRGLVFSVRKVDEVGLDTTVRGLKLGGSHKLGDYRLAASVFGGQLNPTRIDFSTGRLLNGSGSPLFLGFPSATPIALWVPNPGYDAAAPVPGVPEFLRIEKRKKPSYLEDGVVGGSVSFGSRAFDLGLHAAVLLRQSNSEGLARCGVRPDADVDACEAEFPTFGQVEATRLHDQIRNFSASLRVPPIAQTVDGYLEVAGQQQTDGRVVVLEGDAPLREKELFGYAVYANVNVTAGAVAATLEGKHYRSFFALGANIDAGAPPFGAPELNLVTYSRPPNAESIYTEPLGTPDLCNTGGRGRLDFTVAPEKKVFAWLGRYLSYSEIDATNNECNTDDELRTDTWDSAAGLELSLQRGATHYGGWLGARFVDRAVSAVQNSEIPVDSSVFYREGYVRYDITQKLGGPFSLGVLGYHRRRYEPTQFAEAWNEGENLVALNFNPHWSFVFGTEYQTRPGFPTSYFNGAVQYRSQASAKWHQKVFDAVRLFVGQRRAALRCVGGVCRVFPAFEGARLELVSEF
ncbi:MAG: hypothetical protein EXR75_07085 [Myxococcales bacterium]|nr:hypothetical protein [Myxococcales bacterium]